MKKPFLQSMPIEEAERRLLDTGLVYAINKLILHPHGLALTLVGDLVGEGSPDGPWKCTRAEIMTTGEGKPIHFASDTDAVCRAKLEAFIMSTPATAATSILGKAATTIVGED